MRIDPDTCTDPVLLAAEVTRLQALVQSLRGEVREQRKEIAGLREERRALLDADRPQPDRTEAIAKRESDRSQPIAIATDNAAQPVSSVGDSAAAAGTSVETGIPPEWTSKPYYVDPPEGWRYGFPRLYDPATDGPMRKWMIANGYPKKLANLGLPCTFTAVTEEAPSATDGAAE